MNDKPTAWQCIRNINEHSALLLLMLLICTDLVFIALHSINGLTSILNSGLFSFERDRSYPEMYQYIKWFWIVVLMIYLAITRRPTLMSHGGWCSHTFSLTTLL